MQVSEEKLKFWSESLDHGDKKKIRAEFGISPPTIGLAFKGYATEKTITLLDRFFTAKKKRLSQEND